MTDNKQPKKHTLYKYGGQNTETRVCRCGQIYILPSNAGPIYCKRCGGTVKY